MRGDLLSIRDSHPAPSSELPAGETHFMLGCGACEHSFCFSVLTGPSTEVARAIVGDISPRRETHQNLTLADANTVCPSNGEECPSGVEIDAVVSVLGLAELLDRQDI